MKENDLLNINKTYSSNNPCFPRQLFHVLDYELKERFGKNNIIVRYERWAFRRDGVTLYKVETQKSWLVSNHKSFIGRQLPDDLQVDFDKAREFEISQSK